MPERNEVRVSDQDPEMIAIKAISAALVPLDDKATLRVLKWADGRYGWGKMVSRIDRASEMSEFVTGQLDMLTRGVKLFEQTCKSLNLPDDMPPIALAEALNRLFIEAAQDVASKATADD